VGPYLSGKTTLLESLMLATGATNRKGSTKEGNTVGDSAPEARARKMSVEVNAAATEYLGEKWTFLDCPGSIELTQETRNALMVADVAVIVCEPEVSRALTLAPLFKFLDDRQIPHMLFINKMDTAAHRVRDVLAALQGVSSRKLILRQVPIRKTDKSGAEAVSGFIDLVSERAYNTPGNDSDLIQIPADVVEREQMARRELLEALADFDDRLLEQLLEDAIPPKEEIYHQLSKDLAGDLIVPVLLGAADQDHGIQRLLKALRHDVPGPAVTATRIGVAPAAGDTVALVCKTYHQAHTGKISLARIWGAPLQDGGTLDGHRYAAIYKLRGHDLGKQPTALNGEVVGLGRMDTVVTGQLLTASGKSGGAVAWPAKLSPLFSLAINVENRADEVKLTSALQKLVDEDPSLSIEHNQDTHELVLWGQGEIHLQVAIDRLKLKYGLAVKSHRPTINYKETIRRGIKQHGRHKKQSGGHGQFGDVHVEIKPLSRGSGFEFIDNVVGGSVPRQYISSVEEGARDYLNRGPLGFPVVDVSVRLYDGQYHSVDSSDMAFKTAARIAMSEGMPKCDPVLLEPICSVQITIPSEFTARVHGLISGRRGQILGFSPKEGWQGWDQVDAYLPQSELHDLIIELRSLTMGVGTFSWKFDHLQELTGRLADKIVEHRLAASH
jgi:elongation factor G